MFKRLKEVIMKASRFIFNTDYATTQNDAEFTISLTIPGIFDIPRTETKIFKTTVSSPGSASKAYRCYFKSTAYSYALTGCVDANIKIGDVEHNDFYIVLSRKKDEFELSVYSPADVVDRHFNTQAQIIEAHIQTFVDPFSA